jgi:hypothetical protein
MCRPQQWYLTLFLTPIRCGHIPGWCARVFLQWRLFVRVAPDSNWHSSIAAMGSNTTAAFLPTLMSVLHGKQWGVLSA